MLNLKPTTNIRPVLQHTTTRPNHRRSHHHSHNRYQPQRPTYNKFPRHRPRSSHGRQRPRLIMIQRRPPQHYSHSRNTSSRHNRVKPLTTSNRRPHRHHHNRNRSHPHVNPRHQIRRTTKHRPSRGILTSHTPHSLTMLNQMRRRHLPRQPRTPLRNRPNNRHRPHHNSSRPNSHTLHRNTHRNFTPSSRVNRTRRRHQRSHRVLRNNHNHRRRTSHRHRQPSSPITQRTSRRRRYPRRRNISRNLNIQLINLRTRIQTSHSPRHHHHRTNPQHPRQTHRRTVRPRRNHRQHRRSRRRRLRIPSTRRHTNNTRRRMQAKQLRISPIIMRNPTIRRPLTSRNMSRRIPLSQLTHHIPTRHSRRHNRHRRRRGSDSTNTVRYHSNRHHRQPPKLDKPDHNPN